MHMIHLDLGPVQQVPSGAWDSASTQVMLRAGAHTGLCDYNKENAPILNVQLTECYSTLVRSSAYSNTQ